MLDWIPLGPPPLAAAGFAAGLYLACCFAWPRKLYARIFGGTA
ncbi:MAG: hypothetical protein ACREIP_09615 [Alphaproteobacteria bacterium]